jgi:signal peptidase II
MSNFKDRALLPFLVFLLVFGLDQLTKHLIRANLALFESVPDAGFFRLVHVQNTGAAFGIFDNATPILAVSSSIAMLFLVWLTLSRHFPFLEGFWGRIGLGLAAGGTMGNLFDRVYYGFVTDFLKAGPWPAFNVADASVVSGMLLLAFLFLRSEQAGAD